MTNVDFNVSYNQLSRNMLRLMKTEELRKIIIKKQKKIDKLEAILIAHNLFDNIEALED